MTKLAVWAVILLALYYALVELPSPTFEVHKEGWSHLCWKEKYRYPTIRITGNNHAQESLRWLVD